MSFLDFFTGRKRDEDKERIALKKEFERASEWIKHLHQRDGNHENNISELNSRLSTIENDLEEIKKYISMFGPKMFKQPSKQLPLPVYKQTAVEGVQTGRQTGVEDSFLRHLSTMERAIIWVLLNTDQKLSYEDISVLLGKDKSTIRGQINTIRQKQEGVVEELIEKNGKKRVYIPEEIKISLLRTLKKPEEKKKKKLFRSSF